MPDDGFDVFDMDGTLLRVNSFQCVTLRLLLKLCVMFRLRAVGWLAWSWLMRRLRRLSHLEFKKRVVRVFEDHLSEEQKSELVRHIAEQYTNHAVLDALRRSPNSVICTAAPYAIAHRMPFAQDVLLVSALDPARPLEDPTNIGPAKLANLRSRFGATITINDVYTDSFEDAALIDVAGRAFLVKGSKICAIKPCPFHASDLSP